MDTKIREPRRVISESELHAYDGLGDVMRQILINRGEYPRPFRVSSRRKVWLLDEICDWQENKLAAGRIGAPDQAETSAEGVVRHADAES